MILHKNTFYLFSSLLVIVLFFIFLQSNDILIGWGSKLYTNYDSVFFYENRVISVDNMLFDKSYNYIAYKAYPIFLSYINSFYSIFH